MAEQQTEVQAPTGGQPAPTAQPAATTEPTIVQPVSMGQQPAVTPAPQVQQPVVSERTAEQFEKLKDSNQKLFDANKLLQQELTRRAKSEQTFAPIQQTPTVPAPAIEQFVETDPITGEQYVNQQKLTTALADATQRATHAESAVQNYIKQQQVLEQEKQESEAYGAHPEVDPSNQKFDAEISRRTRALLLDSMMNPQDYRGRTLTFKEAADEAKKQNQVQAATVEVKTQQTIDAKQQATAGVTGVSGAVAQQTGPGQTEEVDTLRNQTRFGRGDESTWAVAKRLTKVPHTGTPTSST